MYQRKSKIQSLIILIFDCICIIASLILANYIRNIAHKSLDGELWSVAVKGS